MHIFRLSCLFNEWLSIILSVTNGSVSTRHNTSFRPVNTKPDSAVISLRMLPWSFVKPKKYQKPLHNFWDDLQHNLQRQIWTNKMRLWSFSSRTVAQMLMVDITKFDCREKKFMKSSDFYNLWALYIHLLSAKWFAVLVWFISFMQTKMLTNHQETIFFIKEKLQQKMKENWKRQQAYLKTLHFFCNEFMFQFVKV